MNDTPSSGQPAESSSARRKAEQASDEGRKSLPEAIPSAEDQPTVISNRPPMVASPPAERDATDEPDRIRPGARLGHFELLEFIGGGGMGRVFRARDTRLARTVALKVLPREQVADASSESLLRFRNEARSAARLNHEGIVKVYYVGEHEGVPFIVFEYIEGINIRDLVRRHGPLPLADAISYTLQVADALQHAASHNVVHRDIKPSNVLITPEGRAKLIDMGLARLARSDEPGSDLTASGVTLGTFDYISPEQARDPRNADVRSDLYSLGCTLFFMLAGRPPFPEGTWVNKLLQHQGDEPPDVRAFRPELPEEASRVVRKMMAKNPRRRYQDPVKLMVALQSLAELVGLQSAGAGQGMWVVPRRRKLLFLERHLPWIAPVAALVAVVWLLHMLWSLPVQPEERISRRLLGTTEEYVPELPPPEQSPGPSEKTDVQEGASPKLSSEPSQGSGTQEMVAPQTPAKPTVSAPDENAVAPPPAHAGTVSPKPAAESVGIDEPNPRSALLLHYVNHGGLRPGAYEGKLSLADGAPVGLSADARGTPAGGQLRGDVPNPLKPPGIRPVNQATPSPEGALIVDPGDEQGMGFTTLRAACDAAADGDVIELRYNGRLDEEPLALADLRLTITAGGGFHPVIAFAPSTSDPIPSPRSMFTLAGSRLTLVGTALELNVPRSIPADRWSMFELEHGEQVSLRGCSLTIRNASASAWNRQAAVHPDVAFFRLRTPLGGDFAAARTLAPSEPRTSITLADCIVRGEAVFLRSEDLQPLDLFWQNGLLATSEWLLIADGGAQTPRADGSIRIELEHLTAVVGGGLCQLNCGEFTPHQLATQIQCTASILMAAGADPVPILEQLGVAGIEAARSRLLWSGAENLYERFEVFWSIRHFDPQVMPLVMRFDQWRLHWDPEQENRAWLNGVQWRQLPELDRPLHTHTPADYALNDATSYNPAVGATADGRDAGCEASFLPPLPAPPAPSSDGSPAE